MVNSVERGFLGSFQGGVLELAAEMVHCRGRLRIPKKRVLIVVV